MKLADLMRKGALQKTLNLSDNKMNNTALHAVGKNKDKTSRYGWTVADKPGEFRYINKLALHIPVEYQRDLVDTKSREIASEWSWFGCGVIIVAFRDGKYWVVDGQHRVGAALRRSEVVDLPCMVFQSDGLVVEAKAFLTVNSGRKPVSAIGKLRALAVAEDADAAYVVEMFTLLGIRIVKTATRPMDITCIGACQRFAKASKPRFVSALTLAAELSLKSGTPIGERVLSGLFYFDSNIDGGLSDARLRKRIKDLGSAALHAAAGRASAYYVAGGMRIWAGGMLSLANKGLRIQFSFRDGPTESAAS